LVQELQTRGVHFTSLEESIDTATPTGKFFFHITGAFAELERNLIRERTQAGLKAARARGRVGGRPFLLNAQQREMLQKLMGDPDVKPAEVQKMFGIGKTALYRYAALGNSEKKGKDHVAKH
jgi:DNA invertase Pin-like site-specific DNA recombinase